MNCPFSQNWLLVGAIIYKFLHRFCAINWTSDCDWKSPFLVLNLFIHKIVLSFSKVILVMCELLQNILWLRNESGDRLLLLKVVFCVWYQWINYSCNLANIIYKRKRVDNVAINSSYAGFHFWYDDDRLVKSILPVLFIVHQIGDKYTWDHSGFLSTS